LFLEGNKWDYEAVNKPIETTFRNELVTVIEKGKALKMPLSDGKPLTRNEAQKIVMKAFNPYNKQLWSFASADYRGGVLVCAFSKHLPNGIGIWWAKGNKVFNVNGIARGKTKKFELTFDKNIDVPEAFDTCNTLR
jgi:hypothetical protein